MDQLTWEALRLRIGVPEANKELDHRTESIFKMLKQLSTVLSDDSLHVRLCEQRDIWFPARDQYERTILHLAAYEGYTGLVKCKRERRNWSNSAYSCLAQRIYRDSKVSR